MRYLVCAVLFSALLGAQEQGSIEGTVFNATNGEVLKKAHVTLNKIGDPRLSIQGVSTDGAGHYVFSGLDPGKYSLVATHTGFIMQQYGAKGPNRSGTVLVLEAGAKLTDVTFRLTQQGVITGRVLEEDGDPILGATIQSMRYTYSRGRKLLTPTGGGVTNDLGEYRIFGLPPGKYYVSVTNRNVDLPHPATNTAVPYEEGYATVFYPNSFNPESASPLDVTPGAQLRGIDVTLSKTRTVRVRGRVVDSNNRLVMDAAVSLIPREQGANNAMARRFPGNMDRKGGFDIHNVVPGSYTLHADAVEEKARSTGQVAIEVGTTNVDGLVVTVGPARDVTGRVVLDGKADLQFTSVNVFLEPKGNIVAGGAGGPTQQDGTFQLHNVAADLYQINVFGLSGNVYLKSVRLGDADVTDAGLDFSQGVSTGELTVVLRAAAGQMSGTVQDDKQQPAAGAQVVLIPEEGKRTITRLYRTAMTDQSGNFVMKGIPPGDYKVFAWEQVEPNAWQDPEFLKPFESRGETVSVKENSIESKQLKAIPAEETKIDR